MTLHPQRWWRPREQARNCLTIGLCWVTSGSVFRSKVLHHSTGQKVLSPVHACLCSSIYPSISLTSSVMRPSPSIQIKHRSIKSSQSNQSDDTSAHQTIIYLVLWFLLLHGTTLNPTLGSIPRPHTIESTAFKLSLQLCLSVALCISPLPYTIPGMQAGFGFYFFLSL